MCQGVEDVDTLSCNVQEVSLMLGKIKLQPFVVFFQMNAHSTSKYNVPDYILNFLMMNCHTLLVWVMTPCSLADG
jgi:hypothetical protein